MVNYIFLAWVLVDKSLDFEITPTASFTISCYHTTGTSGAGKIERTITYDSSPSFDINPQTVTTSNGSKITANVPYGWYFKVSDNANVSGISKVVKITYDEDGNTTKTTLSETTGKLAWDSLTVYVSDGDYEFTSDNDLLPMLCFLRTHPPRSNQILHPSAALVRASGSVPHRKRSSYQSPTVLCTAYAW